MKPKVYLPKQRSTPVQFSCNWEGAFKRIAFEWGQAGLAEVIPTDSPYVWWGGIGQVLLYDRPTLQCLHEGVRYKVGLFGNPFPPNNGRINSPWFFWPRDPFYCERYHRLKPFGYDHRPNECMFIGGYENVVQRGIRSFGYWKTACDLFLVNCSRYGSYQQMKSTEYLRAMRRSRFALCLPGYGPKCHREVEAMAAGTVPILTAGVSTHYADPIHLGTHYLFADSPPDAVRLMRSITPARWRAMSEAGRDWYRRNAAVEGSFQTTQKIITSLV